MTEPLIVGRWIESRLKGRTSVANRVYYGIAPQREGQDDPRQFPAILYHMQAGDYVPASGTATAHARLTFLVRVALQGSGPGAAQTILDIITQQLCGTDGRPLQDTFSGYSIKCWLDSPVMSPPEVRNGIVYHHPGAFFGFLVTKTI